jgi:fatty-acyl-CoA synthase
MNSNFRSSRTLAELIEELCQQRPDQPALSTDGQTLTFAQVRALAMECAKALYADGVRKGDKVGVLMGNRAEWLIAHFGAQYLGAMTVGLNTWYTAPELEYVVAHADISVLFAVNRFARNDYVEMLSAMCPLQQRFPLLRTVVMLGGEPAPDMVPYETFLARGAGVGDETIDAARQAGSSTDIALLLYTSGSTARPKGVLLQHDGLVQNCFDIGERLHFDGNDVLLSPISLFWGLGCSNALMAAWTHGMHLVLQEQFDAREALELIERHRCTALYGTANIVAAIMDHPDRARRDVSTLRKGIVQRSGSRLNKVIEEMLPLACQCYGFTEGYGNSTVTDAADSLEKRRESVGRVLPGSEIRVVDPESEVELPRGATGEIRIRGYVMAGYYKQPQVTADSFDAAGFYKTGDLGYLDEDGALYFRGRLKEIIKTGGMNVSPAELEAVLRSHAQIEEALATGLPDPERDEIVAVAVIPSEGACLTTEEILEFCRSRLAAYKMPKLIRFVSAAEVPLTTTGKVHKARLPELFAGAGKAPG